MLICMLFVWLMNMCPRYHLRRGWQSVRKARDISILNWTLIRRLWCACDPSMFLFSLLLPGSTLAFIMYLAVRVDAFVPVCMLASIKRSWLRLNHRSSWRDSLGRLKCKYCIDSQTCVCFIIIIIINVTFMKPALVAWELTIWREVYFCSMFHLGTPNINPPDVYLMSWLQTHSSDCICALSGLTGLQEEPVT